MAVEWASIMMLHIKARLLYVRFLPSIYSPCSVPGRVPLGAAVHEGGPRGDCSAGVRPTKGHAGASYFLAQEWTETGIGKYKTVSEASRRVGAEEVKH